jgi:hypothetical protein
MAVTINASTSAGLVQTADTSGVLQLQTNSGTTAVTINTSQNVGIGTASPNVALVIERPSNNAIMRLRDSTASVDTYFNSDSTGTTINLTSALPMMFKTTDTERMRINSSGNVQIGTTTAATVTYGEPRLTVADGASAAKCVLTNVGVYEGQAGATVTQYVALWKNPNGIVGSISTNGSATAYNTSSDYRLKENIVPMTGALDKVALLKPVTYKWKVDGSDGQGFIAHELQEVVAGCVSGEKDAVETYTDEDGIEQTRPKYQGIDTSFLVATLTAAIQEQQTLIVSQSNLINDLNARVTALEAK